METLLHNINLKFPTHGPWTQITLQFFLENGWLPSLLINIITKSTLELLKFQFLTRLVALILKYLSLKSLSEQKIKMADLLLPGHCTTSSLAISFSDFFWRDYDISARLWCHYKEFPAKNWGNPLEIANLSWFHLVMCMPITLMIPVLFKTSIKASPHPLPTPIIAPLPHPPSPTHSHLCVGPSFGHF